MGRLTRWLRGLLRRRTSSPAPELQPEKEKEKQRWPFHGSSRGRKSSSRGKWSRKWSFSSIEAAAPRSSLADPHHKAEESDQAVAVAVAAAAAEAAMVAAAEVLRLTRRGKVAMYKEVAAVRIQAAFRGYLARRALGTLKGLVRLQALVRGHIVRKRLAEMLRRLQAAQAKARLRDSCRSLLAASKSGELVHRNGPATPEKHESVARSMSARNYTPPSPKTSSSKPRKKLATDHHRNLLDQLVERRNSPQLRLHDERSTKIDTSEDEKITLKSFHSLFHNKVPKRTIPHEQAASYSSLPEFQSKQLPVRSSAYKLNIPSPPSIGIPSDDTSPGISTLSKTDGYSVSSHFSAWSTSYPSYMAGTESSRAKSRPQSAPRHRPEIGRSTSMRKPPAVAVQGGRMVRGKSGMDTANSKRASLVSSTQAKVTSKTKVGLSRFM